MMYNLELLERPSPFEEGNLTLWSNEYIASNVIKRHLDFSVDSGSRKKITIERAVKWIASKCICGEFILDIGCGPGLYSALLCDCGFKYHGIDVSKFQIEYAIKHNTSEMALFETVDFREFEPRRKYSGVLLLYAIYSLYNYKDRISLLRKIKSCLMPNGKVIIEVFTKQHYANRKESRDWEYVTENGFWAQKPYIELNAFYCYEDLDLYLVQAAVIQKSVYVWNSWVQTFTVESLMEELEIVGFTEFEFYSSCTGEAYNGGSEVICVCAK